MTAKAKFWDKIADTYFKTPIGNPAVYERKLSLTRDYLTSDSQVLEFGCGTGGTAIAHAPHVKSILATDISPAMLEIARRQAQEAGVTNITFQEADFDTLDMEPDQFDAVFGLSILHLLHDRRLAMSKVMTLLKPGGVFISSTACLGNRLWFMAPFLWLGRVLGRLPLVRIFTTGQLVRSLEESGFVIEQEWLPKKAVAVFVVARKPDEA